jgi:hypothetical protein
LQSVGSTPGEGRLATRAADAVGIVVARTRARARQHTDAVRAVRVLLARRTGRFPSVDRITAHQRQRGEVLGIHGQVGHAGERAAVIVGAARLAAQIIRRRVAVACAESDRAQRGR